MAVGLLEGPPKVCHFSQHFPLCLVVGLKALCCGMDGSMLFKSWSHEGEGL